MIRNEDFRPMPEDWDCGLVHGELAGVAAILCYGAAGTRLERQCWAFHPTGDAAVDAEAERRLKRAVWQAQEMVRLQDADPDYQAWVTRQREFGHG